MRLPRIITAILALLAISLNVAAGDWQDYKRHGHKSSKWTPLVEAGFSAYESGNLDAAVGFFQRAMGKGCKDGLVYFNMGVYYESGGDLNKAKKYFELAKKYLPQRYPSHLATKTIHEHLGRISFTLGNMAEAKVELMQAVKSQGENFTLMFLLGSIARQENDDERVVNYYGKALTFPPPEGTNPQEIAITLLIEIGKSYFNLKQYDNSLRIWDKVLELAPDHPIARQQKDYIQRKKM